MTAGFVTACADSGPKSNSEFASTLKIDGERAILECVGGVNFMPEPGIAKGTYKDIEIISTKLCGTAVEIHQMHSTVGSYPESNLPKLEKVMIEFSCAEGTLSSSDINVDYNELCAEVFENFAAKQSQDQK